MYSKPIKNLMQVNLLLKNPNQSLFKIHAWFFISPKNLIQQPAATYFFKKFICLLIDMQKILNLFQLFYDNFEKTPNKRDMVD